ncbi:permease for cytosine/purines, uracil, thiamine, allantoin-domain-containing protein [Hysterangium stoloniferum]|nr:permease for cytosine/purines, uracil, thiamine, allantoin-domain-containing protein [Hysterangium stoloniferum]
MSPHAACTEEDVEHSDKSRNHAKNINDGVDIEDLGAGAATKESGVLGKMWKIVKIIDKYGVEARGIERVLPHEKLSPTRGDWEGNLWMWFAANCTISVLSLGTLGPSVFFLSGKISILVIIFFNLLSTFPSAFFAIFGAKLGIRQMTVTRFSFGYWVAMFPVALHVIACLGWSTISTIASAQTLRAASPTNQIPTAAAIVIMAMLTFFTPFFGYKVVHAYERYAWIPVAIIFFIILGFSAKYMDLGNVTSDTVVTGDVLRFGAAVFGFGISWSACSADYTVHMAEDISAVNIFVLNYIGLNVPLILVQCLGAGMATVTRQDWQDAFNSGGVGGLIGATLSPAKGFGKFCLVLTALSSVANNTLNMYSFALTCQVLGKYAQMIPRVFLVLGGTIVYVVLAIVGANHFESWLDTLLVILSYWMAIYCTILLEEHFIFRKGRWENYNVADYTNHKHLPLGLAAALTMGIGIMGAVMGMATLWYVGVLGQKIGDPLVGGDIGFELSMGFSAIVYPILRSIEIRFEGPQRMGTRK